MGSSAAGYLLLKFLLSPHADLSPGLAALTLGCDSGNLGSLSRVQLLLLDRQVPETLLSPSALEEAFSPVQEWSDVMMQYDDPGRAWKMDSEEFLCSLEGG